MQLVELAGILGTSPLGSLSQDAGIGLITSDSRQAGPGTVFVALAGAVRDGHDYIAAAIDRGCLAVVAERCPEPFTEIPCFQVADTHQALGELTAAFYDRPADKMRMIALTGTNGKTTTSWLLEGILKKTGCRVGVIGTVNYRYESGDGRVIVRSAPLTTPDPVVLQGLLREMADAGVTHVIVEASSHALAQKRLAGIHFDVAVFTNLSRDHLDYHRDMEEYFTTKKKLFIDYMKPSGSAVVVTGIAEEDDYGRRLADDLADGDLITVGFDEKCSLRAVACRQSLQGVGMVIQSLAGRYEINSALTGRYNMLNMLAAAGAATALSVPKEQIRAGLVAVDRVPGRLERIIPPGLPEKDAPVVFVDYAHTPAGLENVLTTLKDLTDGRLICVFGCGGDRDTGKRALMGEVAGAIADVVLLTSDNPRTENPLDIIAQAVPGLQRTKLEERRIEELFASNNPQTGFMTVEDRATAIRQACALATPDDVILIAGKGHEQYQIVGREKSYFDDRMQVKNGLTAWTIPHLVRATGGEWRSNGSGPISLYGKISTDTRTLQPGDVFVALKGENFDGHAFIQQAIAAGAGALIVEELAEIDAPGLPVIRVGDTLRALGDLAAYRRRLFGSSVKVIALTGSSGKTTIKEMMAAICNRFYATSGIAPSAVLKTRGNFNNLIGLPLTLLELGAEHEVAILEMGMNRPGEIARLTEIAGPDIGCINNVQAAHLQGLGDINGVAAAKGELFAGLSGDAVFVVNDDDPLVVRQYRKYGGRKVGFAVTGAGRRRRPVIRITRIVGLGEQGSRITLQVGDWKKRFILSAPGMHNVANAAAAAAMAHAAGIDGESIAAGLAGFSNIDKRMEFARVPGGLRVINDSYNANPSSMDAALRTMATFSPDSRRIAALGDMLELGDEACACHRRIGRLAAELGYDLLAVTGDYRQEVVAGAREAGMAKEQVMGFIDTVAMADWLYHLMISGRLGEEDWLLIKGSRGMRMERLLDELQNRFDPSRNRG